jgi:hypothetical protein
MGFYKRHLMPNLINYLCRISEVTDQRRKLVPQPKAACVNETNFVPNSFTQHCVLRAVVYQPCVVMNLSNRVRVSEVSCGWASST